MREYPPTDEESLARLRQALIEDLTRFGILTEAGVSLDSDVTPEAIDRGAVILQRREPPLSDQAKATNRR